MKLKKHSTVKLYLSNGEIEMFQEIIEKIILSEAPVHNIGILNSKQIEFITNLQKLIGNGPSTAAKKN